MGRANRRLAKPGEPICARCGWLRRSWVRFNRRRAGNTLARVCCCDPFTLHDCLDVEDDIISDSSLTDGTIVEVDEYPGTCWYVTSGGEGTPETVTVNATHGTCVECLDDPVYGCCPRGAPEACCFWSNMKAVVTWAITDQKGNDCCVPEFLSGTATCSHADSGHLCGQFREVFDCTTPSGTCPDTGATMHRLISVRYTGGNQSANNVRGWTLHISRTFGASCGSSIAMSSSQTNAAAGDCCGTTGFQTVLMSQSGDCGVQSALLAVTVFGQSGCCFDGSLCDITGQSINCDHDCA